MVRPLISWFASLQEPTLALMPPKLICSPSRPAQEPITRHRRSTGRAPTTPSPLFKARVPKQTGNSLPIDDEPTSPKVTCAGQIKSRSKKPNEGTAKKKPSWLEALGIKKEALPFLNALQGLRFNMVGCFSAFPGAVDYTSDEDEDDEEAKEVETSAALSKWFMVLEEGKKDGIKKEAKQEQESVHDQAMRVQEEEEEVAPPKNALLLMRCRSAPANGWLERKLDVVEQEEHEEEEVVSAKKIREEEKEKEKLVLMSYAPDFFKVSVDIAKETWIVGSGEDAVARCRSWKR